MIGHNDLTLNEATMIEAVQEWLDKRWAVDPKPKVKSVKMTKRDRPEGYGANTFTVELEVQEAKEPS